jgi:hypothetical protein
VQREFDTQARPFRRTPSERVVHFVAGESSSEQLDGSRRLSYNLYFDFAFMRFNNGYVHDKLVQYTVHTLIPFFSSSEQSTNLSHVIAGIREREGSGNPG